MDTRTPEHPAAADTPQPRSGDWNEVLRLSHDINNYLGAIAGFAEMLGEDAAPGSPLLADLHRVLHAARQASSLVEALSDYARRSLDGDPDPS